MKLSPQGLALIKQFEGLSLQAYQDAAGVPTIGYGHTFGVKMGMQITAAEADRLLAQDVAHFEQGINRLTDELGVKMTQSQFDALVCFAFNVGLGNVKKSTLLKKLYLMNLQDQTSITAVALEFTRWNKAGGKTLAGLMRRRQAESALFLQEV